MNHEETIEALNQAFNLFHWPVYICPFNGLGSIKQRSCELNEHFRNLIFTQAHILYFYPIFWCSSCIQKRCFRNSRYLHTHKGVMQKPSVHLVKHSRTNNQYWKYFRILLKYSLSPSAKETMTLSSSFAHRTTTRKSLQLFLWLKEEWDSHI